MLSRLFIAALWSSAGKGLTSWHWFVMFYCFCHFPMWYLGSGVVLDCIGAWSLPLFLLWAMTRDFQQCGMRLAKAQTCLCIRPVWPEPLLLLEYSMNLRLQSEQHLEFVSLKGGCTGSSTLVKMPHCWKSCFTAQLNILIAGSRKPLLQWLSGRVLGSRLQDCISPKSLLDSRLHDCSSLKSLLE